MTVKDFIYNHLRNLAILDKDIDEICESIRAGGDNASVIPSIERKEIEGYPDFMKKIITVSVNSCALAWMKKEKPEHFMMSLFEELCHGKKETKNV